MTAANILIKKNAAFIATDTKVVTIEENDAIVPRCFMTKVFPLQHIDTVVVASGFWLAGQCFAQHLNTARTSFDDVVDHLQADIAKIYDAMKVCDAWVKLPWNVHVIGWSDREGQIVGKVVNSDRGFEVEDFGSIMSPIVEGFSFGEDFQLARDGLELLNAQRAAHPYAIGGKPLFTTLRRGSVLMTTGAPWPEVTP